MTARPEIRQVTTTDDARPNRWGVVIAIIAVLVLGIATLRYFYWLS